MKTQPESNTRRAYDLTGAELENSALARLAEEAGYPSLKSVLNEHNLWSFTIDEVESHLRTESPIA